MGGDVDTDKAYGDILPAGQANGRCDRGTQNEAKQGQRMGDVKRMKKLLAILQAVASVILAGVVIVAGCMATFVVLWLMLQALAC